jgi:hypothetical protein
VITSLGADRMIAALESIASDLHSVAQSLRESQAQISTLLQKLSPQVHKGQAKIVKIGSATYSRPADLDSQVPGLDRRGDKRSEEAQRQAQEKFRRPHPST